MKVYEAMTRNPETLSPQATIAETVKVMVLRKIGSILVTEEDELKGILTERDILERVIAKERDPKTTRLKDVMTQPVINVEGSAELVEASDLMKKNNIRRLAVLSEEGKLVGIITVDDIARSLRRSAEELALTYYIMARSRR